MAVLPIASREIKPDTMRQIDLNFRELNAEIELLKKRVKELEEAWVFYDIIWV